MKTHATRPNKSAIRGFANSNIRIRTDVSKRRTPELRTRVREGRKKKSASENSARGAREGRPRGTRKRVYGRGAAPPVARRRH